MQQIASPKTSRDWVLLPNHAMLTLHWAECLAAQPGAKAAVAPAAEVFSVWVRRTAARIELLELRPFPASAGAMRVQLAWQQAIQDTEPGAHPSLVRNLARRARAADRLIRHWYAGLPQPWLDARFLDWRRRAELRLAGSGWFQAEDWLELLRLRLERDAPPPIPLPAQIEMKGFIELTLLEHRLLEALRARGVRIVPDAALNTSNAPPASGIDVRSFATPAEELRAVATWSAEHAQRGGSRVAVIVADAGVMRDQLAPVFDRILHPQDGPVCAADGECRYHLPAGVALAGSGLVADALMLLRLSLRGGARAEPFPVLSRLVLSPHIRGAEAERIARAQFELRLRATGRHRRSPQELARLIRQWNLEAALPDLLALLGRLPRVGRSDDPAISFPALLADWGWPGSAARGRLAQQRVERFVKLTEELRHAGLVPGPAALETLAQACRDTCITERGGPLSPVQVLAPEDAVGASFDAVWVMSADGDTWPGRPDLNPLLPADAGERVPRTTAAGTLEYTRRLHAALLRTAPSVVFSWSQASADALRLPSPLLTGSPGAEPELAPQEESGGSPWAALLAAERPVTGYAAHPYLRAVDDAVGLPVPPGELLPGGAGLLEAHSGCPLDAYLRYRLRAAFDPMPGPFADAAYRGTLLHAALYHLFAGQRGRAGLPPAAGIEAAIEAGLAAKHAVERLDAVSLAAERVRLNRALHAWLHVERERQAFVVEELEREAELDYAGVRIGTRIDRIDRLEDGRWMLLDYKSSNPGIAGWGRERLDMPQLPLYAVLLTECEARSIAGIAIGVVKSGAAGYAGIAGDAAAAWKGIQSFDSRRAELTRKFSDWDALYRHWKSGIDAQLAEIVAGEAPNRVWNPEALEYSGAHIALRLNEGEAWLAAHGCVVGGSGGGGDDD